MKFLSKDASGYLQVFKPGILLLMAVGLIRLLLGPLGIPISIGGKIFSLTVAILVLIAGYAIYFGLRGGKLGDILVSGLCWVVVYTLVLSAGMAFSHAAGIQTYYLDPAHVGPNPNIPRHLLAHVRALPFASIFALVIGLVFFGLAWLTNRFVLKKSPT